MKGEEFPNEMRLLKQLRRATATLKQDGLTPAQESLLGLVDIVLNELLLHGDPAFYLRHIIVDTTEYDTGRIYQVIAYGDAEVTPYDIPRARRMLERYMGPDQSKWSSSPTDYPGFIWDGGPPGAVWLRVKPKKLQVFNFSYTNSPRC